MINYKGVVGVRAATVHWRHSPGEHGQAVAGAALSPPGEGLGDGAGLPGKTQNGKIPGF